MDALKHHKRYLAMLTALSMLVTFIVPLILMEPADSMSGILICGKTEHIHDDSCYEGGYLTCGQELHTHSEACYLKYSATQLKEENLEVNGETLVFNAGGGYDKDTGTYTPRDAHPVVNGNNVVPSGDEYYNPASLPLYTLLFGEPMDGQSHWVDTGKTLDENLLIANQEYFLGFASDFCAFIESDFTAFDADAEGRMFVGGDLIFKGIPDGKKWNYQIGAGDYGQFKPIWDTDEYGHLVGFASGIIGGKVYRVGTMTTGAYASLKFDNGLPTGRTQPRHTDGNDVMLYPEEGAYKRFIVGNLKDSLHYDEDGAVADISYRFPCDHLYYDHACELCKNLSREEMGTTTNEHSYLREVNELSQFYIYDDVSTILAKTFDTLRARSLSLASIDAITVTPDNNTLTLDATNIGDAKTVYFKVNDWKNFDNILIKVPSDRVTIGKSPYTNNNDTITDLNLNIIVSCDDKEIEIKGRTTKVHVNGTDYQISKSGGNETNNHPVSSNILYNFYNASTVEFVDGCNFNGTIFAPYADASAPEECPGHLSGALIAKSFYGGLEFGYRPYRGGVDIFGMVSGYAIPVDKIDQDNAPLPGALFAIKEDAKFVSLFESGNNPNFAALPSRVDFTGNNKYSQESIAQSKGDRFYAGDVLNGEKLSAPVNFELYSNTDFNNQNSKITIVTGEDGICSADVGNRIKFYLKPDQNINIVENENFKCTGPDNNGVYTIQLIKPVNGSFDITVQNAYDVSRTKTVTINAKQNMTLDVTANERDTNGNQKFEVGHTIKLTPYNQPTGADKFYYKYFVNGNPLQEENVYKEGALENYEPTSAGNMLYSVKAFINIDGVYYEVAQAESKITIKDKDISAATVEISPKSVTAGSNFTIMVNGLPKNATVEYYFIDDTNPLATQTSLNDNTSYTVSTEIKDENGQLVEYIAGKDLPIIVKITDENGQMATRNDTITVNFKEDMALTGYDTNYTVNANTKPYEFKLSESNYKDAKITYYFYNQPLTGNTVTPTLVNISIPVYAKITANGLEKTIYGANVYGTYDNNILGTLTVASGAFRPGDKIGVTLSGLTLDGALKDATIVFRASDSYGNPNWKADGTKNDDGTWTADFSFEQSGDYTIRAFMLLNGNPDKEVGNVNVRVEQQELTGDLSINPSQINTGSEIEFKVYGATEGASVQFSIYDQNNNYLTALYGTVNNGECTATYRPTQAGGYSVKAFISKDGSQRETQQQWFTVKENTSTLTGEFDIINPNGQVEVKVYNATEGAVAKLTVTGPNNFSHTPSSNIVNGTYTFYFTPSNDGVYTVNVVLEKGSQTYDLGVRTFQRGDVSSAIKGTLSFSRDSKFDDYIRDNELSITFTPEGTIEATKSVQFDIYYYNKNNHWETMHASTSGNNSWTVKYTPPNKGTFLVTATIDGAVVAENSVTVNCEFVFSNDNGQNKVTVSRTDEDEYINEIKEFSITDANNTKHQVTDYNLVADDQEYNRIIEFTPPAGVSGTLYLRVKLSGGAETYCYRTITVENGSVNISSINRNIYGLRKTLKILEDEGTDTTTTDNEILITAPDNGEIDSVRLVLPGDVNTENPFKIKVTFDNGSGDSNPTKEYNTISTDSETGTKYIDISAAEYSNVSSIKIVPVIGSITVDKCYPKYKNEEYIVTKTIPRSFTLKKNEEKEIVLENWLNSEDAVQTLKSLTFNLTSAGSISYALIGKDDTSVPVFKTVQSQQVEDKIKVVINDINAANIEKIKIFTTADSLTVTEYTISAFIGSEGYVDGNGNTIETELKKFLNNNLDIINYYTLVEQQAPTGYFKENTVYTIEVKETIDLSTLAGGVPTKVLTTITVKDPNGSEKMKYTVDVTESRENNITTRTLTIGGVVFTVTKDANGNLTVTSTDENIETSEWVTDKPARYGDYYFDPAAMMIVPVPNSIVYKNTNGLLFRKVNSNGASVFEVMIKMHKFADGEWQDVPEWSWIKGKSNECLLSISGENAAIEPGVCYRFHETDGGGKYLLADDIYMIRDSANTNEIHYWTVGRENTATDPLNTKPENQKSAEHPNGYSVLNLTRENVIRMENQRLPGLELTLLKTKAESETNEIITNDTNDANDAVFSLCAMDGTVLLNNVVVTNGQIDLDVSKVQNNVYVESGYIKPGTYYLKEIKPPTGREASVSDFYFTISVNKNYVYKVESAEVLPGVLAIEERQADGSTHKVLRFLNNALKQLHGANLDEDTPIIKFKFNTDSSQLNYGNASFSAKVNGVAVSPVKSAYPTGCNVHDNGISFGAAEVPVQLTVKQLCDLFGISVENFNTITEFSVHCWNKTTTSDVDFYPIESTGGSSSGSGSGSTMTGGVTINAVAWSTSYVPYNSKIDKLIFYYVNGSKQENEEPLDVTQGTWWHTVDLSGYKKDNVVAIQVQVSGDAPTNPDDKRLYVEDSDGKRIWGQETNGSDTFSRINPGELYTFGSIPTTTTTTATTTTTTVETTTTTAAPIPTLTIDGSNLMVSNVEIGNDMDLRVKKRWAGDEDVTELRQSVTFQLWRKIVKDGNEIAAYTECNPYTNADGEAIGGEVTVGESDNWQYIWENLPRFVNDNTDGTDGLYYYKVTEVTEPKGYNQVGIDNEYSKDFNEGGTVVITNEAEVIDIPISKTWDYGNCGKDVVPDGVMFKLMAKVGNEWIDLPGKTIVLTKPADWNGTDAWSGKFENLPVEFEYKVEECPLHYEHWEVDETNSKLTVTAEKPATGDENAESFAVENDYKVPTGGLEVSKSWLDNNDTANRPAQLKLRLYRTIAKPYYEETDIPYEGDYKSDYARLLQHSLYFYDANMCGADVSVSSKLAWRSNCHIEDEVQGGYHDAGDHVMFGLPQGYTATMLSWMYLEFFKDGTNANTANKSIDSADKAHLKVILERFYDFFASSVKYDSSGEISEILVQKGHGNVDHMLWCSPEKQQSRVSEMIWSSTSGANIAAEYAAALALGYINFHDEDATKYNSYLEIAEKLYRFSEKTSAFAAGDSMGSYYADGDKEDDMQLAAAWLYEATGNESYKDKRYSSGKDISEGLQWDNVHLAAAAATARQDNNWGKVTKFIDENIVNKDFYYIHSWGTARFNTMAQTAVLIAAKNNPDKQKTYVDWAVKQMNKILGDNEWKDTISTDGCTGGTVNSTRYPVCLVTNFAPDDENVYSPQAPHHRAASGWNTHEEYKTNCGYNPEKSYQLIGALVGGPAFEAHDPDKQPQMRDFGHDHPLSNHNYIDDLHDYCCNEVAIDYNSGLVGAAAGLYYFLGTGERSTMIEGVEIEGKWNNVQPYTPDSGSAPILYNETVAKQVGYNMVPFRRTAVSVLEGEPNPIVISSTSEYSNLFEQLKNGNEILVGDILSGKSVKEIIVSLSAAKGSLYLNEKQVTQETHNLASGASWSGSVLTVKSQEINGDNVIVNLGWGNYGVNDILSNNITKLKYEYSDATLNFIEIHYTNETRDPIIKGRSEVNESEYIQLECKNATVEKWSFNDDSTENDAAYIDSNGNLYAKNVSEDTEVIVKATISEGDPLTKPVIVKPKTITFSGQTEFEMNAQSTNLQLPDGCSDFSFKSSDENVVRISWSGDGRQFGIQPQNNATGTSTISAYKIINNKEVVFATVVVTVKAPELSFTNDTPADNSTHNLRQNITFKTNEAANWTASPNDSSIVQLTPSSDNKECTVKFLKYTDQAVTITATSQSDTSKSVSRTIYADKATLSLAPAELEVGENIKFTVNNVTNDGITWEYYVNDKKLDSANSNPYTYTVPEAGDKSVYAVIKSGDVVVDTTAAQSFTVKAPTPKIDGADEMFEGESKTYTLDGATDWQISSGNENNIVSISSTTEGCTLSSIANVNENTKIVISANVSGYTDPITKEVVIKPITINGPTSMGVGDNITISINEDVNPALYKWEVVDTTPTALNKIVPNGKECVVYSRSEQTGTIYIGLYIIDTDTLLVQKNISVASGEYDLSGNNSVQVGDKTTLQANGHYGTYLSIRSGSDKIYVNGMDVYGLADGDATVVAIDQEGKVSVPYTITVTKRSMSLKGISNMLVGQTLTLNDSNNIEGFNNDGKFAVDWSVEDGEGVIEYNSNEKKITTLTTGSFKLVAKIRVNQNNPNKYYALTLEQVVNVNTCSIVADNTIDIDETKIITFENLPSGSRLDWQSNDKISYSLNSNTGKHEIKGIVPGETTIKFKIRDNNWTEIAEVSKKITVNNPDCTINAPTIIRKDSKSDISITGVPTANGYSFEWTKEGSAISVENNNNNYKVVGEEEGTAKLIAIIKYNGNEVCRFEHEITVTPPAMSLSLTSATIEIKDEIEIEALNVPDNSDLLWSASGCVEIISKDDNKVRIRGLAVGSGTITVTATPKAATANEPMTVSEDESQTASAAIEVTNVPQYDEHYFIYKEFVDEKFTKDYEFDTRSWLGENEISKIVVKFTSNNGKKYEGIIHWNELSERDSNREFAYTSAGEQLKEIDIDPAVVIEKLKIAVLYLEGEANGRIESIYFYGKVNGPTIINAPASMIVGNEATLGTLGFTANSTIEWEITEGSEFAEIDTDGKLTAKSVNADGTSVTIKVMATNTSNETETDEVSIKINGKPVSISANPSKIKFNGESTITSSQESLKYTIKFENGDSAADLFEIVDGKLKLKAEESIGEETKKLIIQSVGTSTYAPSNAVSVIVYGGIFITGVDELPLSTEHRTSESKLTVKNALGEVTWSIKAEDNEQYVISTEADGSYIVTKDDKTILKLYSNGKIEAGTAAGMVTITATENGHEAEHTVKVTDLPMQPIIPTEGKTTVREEIILTAGNSWKFELASLPTCDQKGNPYYYYFEEYAYTNSTADEGWTLIYSPQNLGYIHANGSYIPVDYVGNGSSLSSDKTSFTIENKQTEKPQGTLPSTGGSGVTTYYYLGGVIMLLSIAGFTGLKRRERKRRKEE